MESASRSLRPLCAQRMSRIGTMMLLISLLVRGAHGQSCEVCSAGSYAALCVRAPALPTCLPCASPCTALTSFDVGCSAENPLSNRLCIPKAPLVISPNVMGLRLSNTGAEATVSLTRSAAFRGVAEGWPLTFGEPATVNATLKNALVDLVLHQSPVPSANTIDWSLVNVTSPTPVANLVWRNAFGVGDTAQRTLTVRVNTGSAYDGRLPVNAVRPLIGSGSPSLLPYPWRSLYGEVLVRNVSGDAGLAGTASIRPGQAIPLWVENADSGPVCYSKPKLPVPYRLQSVTSSPVIETVLLPAPAVAVPATLTAWVQPIRIPIGRASDSLFITSTGGEWSTGVSDQTALPMLTGLSIPLMRMGSRARAAWVRGNTARLRLVYELWANTVPAPYTEAFLSAMDGGSTYPQQVGTQPIGQTLVRTSSSPIEPTTGTLLYRYVDEVPNLAQPVAGGTTALPASESNLNNTWLGMLPLNPPIPLTPDVPYARWKDWEVQVGNVTIKPFGMSFLLVVSTQMPVEAGMPVHGDAANGLEGPSYGLRQADVSAMPALARAQQWGLDGNLQAWNSSSALWEDAGSLPVAVGFHTCSVRGLGRSPVLSTPACPQFSTGACTLPITTPEGFPASLVKVAPGVVSLTAGDMVDKLYYPNGTLSFHPIGRNVAGAPGLTPAQASSLPGNYTQVLLDGQHASTSIAWSSKPETRPPSQYWDGSTWADTGVDPESLPYNMQGVWYLVEDVTEAAVRQYVPATMLAPQAPGGGLDPNGNDGVTPLLPESGYLGRTDAWLSSVPPSYFSSLSSVWPADPPIMLGLYPPGDAEYMARTTVYRLGNPMIVSAGGVPYFYPLLNGETVRQGVEWPARLWGQRGVLAGTPLENRSHIEFKFRLRLPWKDLLDGATYLEPGKDVVTIRVCAPWAVAAAVASCPLSALPDTLTAWGEQGWVDERTPFAMTMVDGAGLLVQSSILARTRPGSALVAQLNSSQAPASSGMQWQGTAPAFRGMTTATALDPLTTWRSPGYDCQRGLAPLNGRPTFCQWAPPLFLTLPAQLRLAGLNNGTGLGVNTAVEIAPFAMRTDMPLTLQTMHTGPFAPLHPYRAWRLGQDMRAWGHRDGRGWLWTMDGQLAVNADAASSSGTNQQLARSLPYVDLSIGMGGVYYLGAPYTPWAESEPVMMPGGLGQWAGETVFGGRAISTLPGSSLVSSMGGVNALWDRSKHSTLRVYSPWTPMASLPVPQGVLQGYAPSRNDNAFGWEIQTSSGGPTLAAAAWWSTEMLFINVYPLMYPAAQGFGTAPSASVILLDAMGYPYKLSKLPPPPAMSWTNNPASNATSVLEKYRATYAVRPQYPEGTSEQEPQAPPDVPQAVGLNVRRFSMSSWSCSQTAIDNVVTRVPTSHVYAGTASINVSVWYPEPYQLAHPTARLCEVGYGTWMDLHFGPGQDKATIPLSIHPDPWGDVSGVPVLQGVDLDRHYVVCAVTLSNPRGVPMDKKTFGGIDNGLVQGRTTRYVVLCRGRGTSSPSDPYGTQYDCPTTTQALPGYLPQVITAGASVNGAQGLPVPGVVAGRRPPSVWNDTTPLGLIDPPMSRSCKWSVLGSVESLAWSTTWPTQVRFLPLGSSVTLAQQGVPINPWEATVLRTPYVFSGPTGPTESYPDFGPSPAPGNSTSTRSPTPTASVTPLPSASSVRGRPEDGLGGGWANSGQPWTIRIPVIRAVSSVPQSSAETPLGPWSEVYARAKAAEAAMVTYRLSISGPSQLSPDSTGCSGLQGGAWDNAYPGLNALLNPQPGLNPCSGLAERVLGEDYQVTVSWGAGDYTDAAYRAAVAVSATPSATVSTSRTPSPTSTPSASLNSSASPSLKPPWFNMEISPAAPPLLPISPGGVGPGQWDMARDPRVRFVEITFRRGDPLRLLNVPALTLKLSPVVTTGVGVARSPAIPDFFIHLCASSTNISTMYDTTLARVCTGAATVQRQQGGSGAGYAQPTASHPRPPAIVGFSSPVRPIFMGDPFSPSPSPPMMPTQTAWPSMYGPPKRRVAAHDGMAAMDGDRDSETEEAARQLRDDDYGGSGQYFPEQCAAADDFGDSGRRYVGGTMSCVSHHAGWQPLPFTLSSLPDFPENWGSSAFSYTAFSFFPALTLRAVLTASVPAGPAMMGEPQMQPILFNSRQVEIPLAWEDIVYLPQSMSVWDPQVGYVRVPRAFPAMLRKNVEFMWSTAGPFVFYGLTGGYEGGGLSDGMQSGTGRPEGTDKPPVETTSPSVNASSSPSASSSSTRSVAPSISSTPTAGFVQPGWPFPSNWTELNITFVLDSSGLNGIAQVDPARNTFTLQYLRPIGPRTVGGGSGGSASPTRQSITRAPSVATPNVTLSLSLTGFNLTVLMSSGDRFLAMTTAAIVSGVNAALQQSGRSLSSGAFRNESVGIRRAWSIPTPASGLAPQVIFINPQYAWEFPEYFAAMSQQQGSGSGSTFSPLPSFTQGVTGTPRVRILQGGGGGPDFNAMLGLRVDIVLLFPSQSDVGTMGPLLDPSSPTQQRATFQQAIASSYRSQDSFHFPSSTFTVAASAPEYTLSSGAPTITQQPRPSAVLPRLTPPTVARAVAALDLGTVVTVASRGSIGANGQEAISGMGAFPLAVPADEEQAWQEWVQSAVGGPSTGEDGWYSRVGGRTWTDFSLVSALTDWLGLPTGGPQGQRAGLQLLNLASQWNPTSPDPLHARLSASVLPPSWGAEDSMAPWGYGPNTSTIMPMVRRLQPQGPPPGLEAYSGGILVTRTQLHEPLVLSADVWAFPKGWTTANSGFDSMGTQNTGAGGLSGFLDDKSQLLPGGPRAVQRAIVTGQSTLFIPDGLGDSRAPGVTAGNRSTDMLTASNPYAPVLSIPGLAVSVGRVTWVLTGIPSPAMEAVFRAAGAIPPHGLPTFPNGTSTGMRQHMLVFTTSTLVATVPPGRLLAGYVYSITASVAGTARLLYADPLPISTATRGTGGSGPVVPRLLQGAFPASNVSASPTPSPSASSSPELPVWRHPTTGVVYLLPIPPTLPAALAAPLLANTGHGVGGQVYSVSAAGVDVSAEAVKSSTVYVHVPPTAGALGRAPHNGTALLTRFTMSSTGWTEDTAARSTAPVPSIAAIVSHLAQAPLPPPVIDAWAGVAQGRYTGWDALSELSRVSAGGSFCTVARNQAVPPAWLIRQSLIALALGTGLDLTCSTIEKSTQAALIRLARSYNLTLGALPVGLPSFTAGLVLPLNYRHAPAPDARALFLPSTLVGAGSQLHSFRVDPTGQAPNGTLALSPIRDISAYSAQLADYAVSPNSWLGSPLAATSSASHLQSTLPIPPQGRTVLHLFAFVRDEEGAVALATAPVAVTLDLRQSGSEGSVGAASAASSFASQVATTLTRDSVNANPFGALLTTASLTNVLANASSSGVGNGTQPTGAEGRAELAELRRNNTALRQSLVDTVGTAVSSIANSSATSIGRSSLSGLLSNWSITVSVSERRDSNASEAGGSTSGPIDAAIIGNITKEALQALRSDTSIALDDGTAVTAASALASLTSDPTELSNEAGSSALSTLSTVLALSLPTNVLMGVSDDGDDLSGAQLGGNASGVGVEVVRSVSPPDPALLAAGASVTLNVLTSNTFADSNATQSAGDMEDRAAIREKAQTTLTLLASTMARDAIPGDPPRSVAAGPSEAFKSAVNNARRLQGQAPLAPESFCGQALVLTTARLSSTNGSAQYNLPVEDTFNPCLSKPDSPVAQALSAAGAGSTQARVVVTEKFVSSGSRSRLVDMQVVQMSDTFGLPEDSGFESFSFTRTGARAGRALSLLGGLLGSNSAATPVGATAAISGLGVSSFAKPTVTDLQPSTGLDSRVLQVNLQTRSGRSVPVTNAPEPIYLTIPLKDFSRPGASVAGEAADAHIVQRFTFTCPMETDAVTVLPGAALPAVRSNSSAQYSFGMPDTLRLAAITQVTYISDGSDKPREPSTCRLPFTTCDSSGKPSGSYSFSNAAQQAGEAARDVTGGGLRQLTRPVFVLTVPCGGLPGPRNISCGPGAYGNVSTYTCPNVVAQPVCTWWDERAGRWAGEGCTVVNVTIDSVTCACTHLTAFAARFAALAADNNDIFAQVLNLGAADYSKAMLMLGIVGSIMLALFVSVILTHTSDKYGDVRFYSTLLADEEVQFLRRIEELKGHTFILDRRLDARKQIALQADRAEGKKLSGEESSESTAGWSSWVPSWLHGESAGPTTAAPTDPMKGGEEKMVMHTNPHMSKLDAAQTAAVKGRRLTTAEQAALASNEASRRRAIEAKHRQAAHSGSAGVAAAAGTGTAVAAGSVAAEMAAEDIATVLGNGRADPYSAALYMRLMEQFEPYRVTADKLAGSAHGKEATAVLGRMVDADMAQELVKDDAAFSEDTPATAEQGKGSAAAMIFKLGRSSSNEDGDDGEGSESKRAGFRPMGFALTWATRGSRTEVVKVDPAASEDKEDKPEPAFASAALPSDGQEQASSDSAAAPATPAAGSNKSTSRVSSPTGGLGGVMKNMGSSFKNNVQRLAASAAGRGEFYKMAIISKAKRKMDVLDDTSAWSCMRAYRLRNFIFKVWMLRLWFTHTYFSIYTRYDPRSPRTGRLLLLASVIIGNMFVTAFFYAFRNGRPGQDLPAMTASETIVLAILASLIQQPIEIVLKTVIEWAGQSEFTSRYPYLWSELNRRKAAEKKLAGMSREALAAELALSGKDKQEDAVELAGELAKQAAQGAAKAVSSAAAAAGGPTPAATVSGSAYLTTAAAQGLISPTIVDGAAAAPTVDPTATGEDSGEAFEYGWVDAPPGVVRTCPCLLRACGRHPAQKATFIAKAAGEEAARMEARRRKLELQQAKKKEQAAARKEQHRVKVAAKAAARRRAAQRKRFEDEQGKEDGGATLPTAATVAAGVATTAATMAVQGSLESAGVFSSPSPSAPAPAQAAVASSGEDVDAEEEEELGEVELAEDSRASRGDGAVESFSDGGAGLETDEDEDGEENDEGGVEFEGDLEGILTAEDAGDYCAAICTTLCGALAAASANRSSRAANKSVKATISKTKSGRYLTQTQHGRQMVTTSVPTKIKPKQSEEKSKQSKRLDEEDDEEHMKEIADTARGYLRAACGICPCTLATLMAYGICGAWVAFCLFYLTLFGLYQPQEATTDFVGAFFISQAFGLFMVQPGILLVMLILQLAIFPAWVPYLLWVPVLGPMVAGKAASTVQGDGTSALTGRMENLTLIRAAGAASMLAPDSALIAYGTTAVLGAAMGGAGRAISKAVASRKRHAEGRVDEESGRGKDGSAATPSALATLTNEERHELIVRRYLVAQLKVAEAARRKKINREKVKQLAFAATTAVSAFKEAGSAAASASAARAAGEVERREVVVQVAATAPASGTLAAAAAFRRGAGRAAASPEVPAEPYERL